MGTQIIKAIIISWLGMLASWALAQHCSEAGFSLKCAAVSALRMMVDLMASTGKI